MLILLIVSNPQLFLLILVIIFIASLLFLTNFAANRMQDIKCFVFGGCREKELSPL